jgi:hypothetical protein
MKITRKITRKITAETCISSPAVLPAAEKACCLKITTKITTIITGQLIRLFPKNVRGAESVSGAETIFFFFYLLGEKPLGSQPFYTNTSCLMSNGLQTYMKCFSVCLCGCVFVCKTPDNE